VLNSYDEAYFNLGGYLVAQEKYEEAEYCYQKVLEIDPDHDKAKSRLKDIQAAIAFRQRILKAEEISQYESIELHDKIL